MPGKYARVFSDYDSYKPVFDTLESLNTAYEKIYMPDHAEFYKYYKQSVLNHFLAEHHIQLNQQPEFEIKEDLKYITASYLIENIDYAFKAWQQPWCRNLSFDNFCEYILPYRYGNEELRPWRKAYYEDNIPLLRFFEGEQDPVGVGMIIKGMHNATQSELTELRGLNNAIRAADIIRINSTTSCVDETGVMMIRLRALGIPASRLHIPNWGNWGSGHDINAVLTRDGKWFPLNGGRDTNPYTPPAPFTIAKVFLELYSRDSASACLSLDQRRGYVIDSTYRDVTAYTARVDTLNIPFPDLKDGTLACLCIFNNKDWIPLAGAPVHKGTASFCQVGLRNMYMPGAIINGELRLRHKPFFVDDSGTVKEITPSAGKMLINVSRKYPPNDGLNNTLPAMADCYFEGSNDSAFSKSVVLWRVDKLRGLRTVRKEIEKARFEYVRIVFPHIQRQHEALGGIQVYGRDKGLPLPGSPISAVKASRVFYGNVFDNDPLTFVRMITRRDVDFNQFYDGENLVIPDNQPFWVGLAFKEPVDITALELSPRTDDNDVIPGETYELYYWDKDWVSLGQKEAISDSLQFTVPQNALLLLKNTRKGREHRLFIVKDGKQVWY